MNLEHKMTELSGKTALVTGGSSGIGKATAMALKQAGYRVIGTSRKAVPGEMRDGIRMIACDVTDDASVTKAVALAHAELGSIDLLVNNAGYGLFGRAAEMDRCDQLGIIDVNVRALTDLSLRFADSVAKLRGGILNVASIASFLPGPGMAVYYASKAYVLSLSEALHQELGKKGVRVTAICPGPVPTEFQLRAGFEPGFDSAVLNVSPAEVARQGYQGLMNNKRLVLPGLGVKIVPFLLRFFPRGFILAAAGAYQQRQR